MDGGFWRRLWVRDRPAVVVVALASALATALWRGTTRPMGDTAAYQEAAELLLHGWPTQPERTPGYPLLLLATGSSHPGTHHLLFAVQLLLHVVAIALVLDVARRLGVGWRGRTALAALLVTPPVLLRVVYEGTEALAAALLTAAGWLLLTPPEPGRRRAWAATLGAVVAVAALVRPTFALLVVPVAVVAASRWAGDPHRRRRRRTALLVALPSLVVVGGLAAYNGIRYDAPGLTPLAAYHLSSRTSAYVQDLPRSYEPARSVLIRERDRALLRGESSAPANYIWRAKPELSRVTGKRGAALDRYVMEIDLVLIRTNPLGYVDAVQTATLNYADINAQPAVLGLGRPAAQLQEVVHLGLLATFLATVAMVPGLALAGRVRRSSGRALVVVAALSLYTLAVSVLVETGTGRLRAPSEPLLALAFVVAASEVHRAVAQRRRRRARPGPAVAGVVGPSGPNC